jgi:hypothetical protein
MQYLLSEEEMAAIRADREAMRKLPGATSRGEVGLHLEALTNVCKMVATTMIPTSATAFQGGRLAGGSMSERTEPYGCIHVDRAASYGYCDRCPVQGICPLPKDYSK